MQHPDAAAAAVTALQDAGVLRQVLPGVVLFRLDQPERGNALSSALVDALAAGVAWAAAEPAIHTFAIHGAGRHFCTGFDLSTLAEETDATLLSRFVRIELLLDALWRAPLRTVAIGHGAIVGAGADLFAVCDQRLLAAGATLRFPGAGFGIVLGTRRLGARVGTERALRWVADGLRIDSAEALSAGLATGQVSGEAGEEAVSSILAGLAPLAVDRQTLIALRAALDDGGSDADLAKLTRSAAAPGLKDRITAYVQARSGRAS